MLVIWAPTPSVQAEVHGGERKCGRSYSQTLQGPASLSPLSRSTAVSCPPHAWFFQWLWSLWAPCWACAPPAWAQLAFCLKTGNDASYHVANITSNTVIQLLPGTNLSQKQEIFQAPPLPEGVSVGSLQEEPADDQKMLTPNTCEEPHVCVQGSRLCTWEGRS